MAALPRNMMVFARLLRRFRRVKPKMARPRNPEESTIKKIGNVLSGLFSKKGKTVWHQGRLDRAVQIAGQNPARGRQLLELWKHYLETEARKGRISRQEFLERNKDLDSLRNAFGQMRRPAVRAQANAAQARMQRPVPGQRRAA